MRREINLHLASSSVLQHGLAFAWDVKHQCVIVGEVVSPFANDSKASKSNFVCLDDEVNPSRSHCARCFHLAISSGYSATGIPGFVGGIKR